MVNIESTIKDWVENYTDTLYQWAFFKLSEEELAKDLVQETFIVAFQKFDTYEGKSNPKTWLISILNHKILDHYRKQYRNPIESFGDTENTFFDEEGMWLDDKRPKEWNSDANLLDNNDFLKTLDACIGKLPMVWSSAIQLKYISEKGGAEICKELNISTTNFWQIIHRAKLNLRQCLDINWFK